MTVSAVRPWRTALQRERRLPSSVTGPVLLRALRRLASICRKLVIEHRSAINGFVLVFRGPMGPPRNDIRSDSPSSFLVGAGSVGFGGAAEGGERTGRCS